MEQVSTGLVSTGMYSYPICTRTLCELELDLAVQVI